MDRFFVAYDLACKNLGLEVTWYFSNCEAHSFYDNMNVVSAGDKTAGELFLAEINSKKYDVVVTHFVELCTSFYKQVKNNSKPYIIAVDHNPRPLKGFPLKKRLKNKLKGIIYSRYIDCFVGVSQYTADCIFQDYGSKLRNKTKVVYNGIDTGVYLKRSEENFGKFIVASHLRESKGLHDLIEAVQLLADDLKKKLSIDIYGEGPMEGELKAKVRNYNLERHINFKGSSSKLPDLLRRYSFLLQPTYMECFSLSILESLAANVPVITTQVGGNREVISPGENGFIFQAGDIEGLRRILEKVVPGELRIENDVSSKIEQEFSLEQMVEAHLKLLPCI